MPRAANEFEGPYSAIRKWVSLLCQIIKAAFVPRLPVFPTGFAVHLTPNALDLIASAQMAICTFAFCFMDRSAERTRIFGNRMIDFFCLQFHVPPAFKIAPRPMPRGRLIKMLVTNSVLLLPTKKLLASVYPHVPAGNHAVAH